jgi:hypothetical protein
LILVPDECRRADDPSGGLILLSTDEPLLASATP